ncbi:MAG: glutamyl-tRNA reductase [Acidimicrobiales bacterium]
MNYRTAPLDVLERFAVADAALPKALHDLRQRPHVSEAVVLATCHRTEVYAVAERFHAGYAELRDFFSDLAGLPPDTVSDALYIHHDDAAAGHLLTVAAGLDSAVIGESEVLGQVADAWERARLEGAAGPALNLLFRHALEAGKRVRTETGVARGITSISQAAVAMAGSHVGGLAGLRALVLGAGSMGEQLAVALADAGVAEVVVTNRTPATATTLATRVGGRTAPLADLLDELVAADVFFTSTGAEVAVLDEADVEKVVDRRHGRPFLIVDVAVPRDVDPAAGRRPGVTLLDMNDLRAFVDTNLQGRRREAERARSILGHELERYRAQATAREAAPLVALLRGHAEALRTAELQRLARRLEGLDPRQRDAVEALTRGIVAKLLHEPTIRLKDAAGTARGERLAETLRELFDL